MKISTVPVCAKKQAQQGMTLVEVMLGAAILAILAVMASTAFFYPRLWVVNSGLEQSAIHAGIAEIERNLYATNSVSLGQFNTDGWEVSNVVGEPLPFSELVDGGPETCDYLVISNAISFRDGEPPVELITYRSLEISSSKR